MTLTPATSALTTPGETPSHPRSFDPDRVAWFEKAAWREVVDLLRRACRSMVNQELREGQTLI